jgi:phosphatidylglycerophosphatase A
MTKNQLLLHPLGLIATGFGSGLSPKMPGTTGSLAALLPAWWLLQLPLWWFAVVIVLTFVLGCIAGHWVNTRLKLHDPGCIVIDEWVGMWITLLPLYVLPPAAGALWLWIALAFVLFRITDIFKPWPASWADRHVHGGLGVMLDDVLAAVWSALLFAAALWWAQQGFA